MGMPRFGLCVTTETTWRLPYSLNERSQDIICTMLNTVAVMYIILPKLYAGQHFMFKIVFSVNISTKPILFIIITYVDHHILGNYIPKSLKPEIIITELSITENDNVYDNFPENLISDSVFKKLIYLSVTVLIYW